MCLYLMRLAPTVLLKDATHSNNGALATLNILSHWASSWTCAAFMGNAVY